MLMKKLYEMCGQYVIQRIREGMARRRDREPTPHELGQMQQQNLQQQATAV